MPDKTTLNFIASKNVGDLSKVRIAGANKPFEQMTISELTQLRPGTAAADSYNINAVSSDVTISSSSILAELANNAALSAVKAQQLSHQKLGTIGNVNISTKITP
ncbi:MAG: hypothetical protein HXX19_10580 [Rhodoferax sp.]|nr:hypothetical protein [Rhodoferax sp.]